MALEFKGRMMKKNGIDKVEEKQNQLASRWSRLWAVLIDTIIALLLAIPVMAYFDFWEIIEKQDSIPWDVTIRLSVSSFALFFMFHGYLLSRYGQTIGKKILNIYIVTLDDKKPDLWTIMLKRYLSILLVGLVPVIGNLLSTLDVLLIFTSDRRCMHDLIAGTKVVRLSAN